MVVGILALQGAVEPHEAKLKALGVSSLQVRTPSDLARVQGLILPGGESTAMIHIAGLNHLWEPLKEFVKEKPAWGICAGLILLANKVSHPAQSSLAALDIAVERNGYGRQIDSFISSLDKTQYWKEDSGEPISGVFIRAPIIRELGSSVKPLLRHNDEIVMVEQGNLMGTSFHPELTHSTVIHRLFLNKLTGA